MNNEEVGDGQPMATAYVRVLHMLHVQDVLPTLFKMKS